MSYWKHRTVRHVNSKFPEEPRLTVHEVYFDDQEKPYLWNPNGCEPESKKECEQMGQAFDEEPVVEVDDATITSVQEGFGVDYTSWKWLVEHAELPW